MSMIRRPPSASKLAYAALRSPKQLLKAVEEAIGDQLKALEEGHFWEEHLELAEAQLRVQLARLALSRARRKMSLGLGHEDDDVEVDDSIEDEDEDEAL